MEQVTKTLGEVHSRLFDHRPSVQGEINYFIKEFEQRRNNREIDRLNKSNVYAQDINRHLEDAGNIQLQYYLPDIQKQVQVAQDCSKRIIGNQVKSERASWLQERRQKRVAEWAQFMDMMCVKSSAVDREIDNEIKRVKTYYKDVEEKLNILDRP